MPIERMPSMHQVIQNFKTGELKVESVPPPTVSAGRVLVQNACSLISADTERMTMDFARKNLVSKAKERPDLVRQVLTKTQRDGLFETFQTVRNRLESQDQRS